MRFNANQLDHPRIGFSVSSRLGNAVRRNLLKRRLRNTARPLLLGREAGLDLVVVARLAAAGATHAELTAELSELLGRVLP